MPSQSTPLQQLVGNTHAVILAAGLGSRLGTNTKEIPKCLVPVAGIPILERMIRSLRVQGIHSLTLAVGYLNAQIREYLKHHHPAIDVVIVENPDYAVTGSVYSLNLALDEVPRGRDALLIEGDVVLEDALLERLLQAAANSRDAATLLAPYDPSLSGTFALVREGKVSAWLHESVRDASFRLTEAYKTVNLTLVRQGQPFNNMREAIQGAISRFGRKAPLEYAMQDLVSLGMEIAAVETAGLRWFEVDTPEDLAIADSMFGEEVP